jgi:hypothetical protein
MCYLLLTLVLAGCMPITPQAEQPGAEKVASAMSGGVMAIAREATVLDWPRPEGSRPGGKPTELRKGSNGWVCRPDDPATPINDPRCFDPSWLQLIGTEPNAEREAKKLFGIGYMLKGGAAADNFDPAATEPTADHDWVIDGPHVMIVSSSDLDPAVHSTDHHSGGPYIMWDGTPAEHLMIPTVVGEVMPSGAPIGNAMSAGPLRISENAVIMDWPSEPGGDLVELRPGDNGWTCLTDDPSTPTNDPMCLDAQWMEWIEAFMTGREPEITAIGIGYMLQGGSTASTSDPTLTEPPAGEEWMVDRPHFMVVAPWGLDPAVYSTDPHSGGPYIMFAGTPYEHLMVPVTE